MTDGRYGIALPRFPATLVGVLLVMAVISAAAGAAIGLMALAASRPEGWTVLGLFWTILPPLGGFALGACLWGAAWLVRQAWRHAAGQARLLAAAERLAAAMEAANPRLPGGDVSVPDQDRGVAPAQEQGMRSSGPAAASDDVFAAVLTELKELNVNILLGEPERRAKRRDVTDRRCEELAQRIRQALASGDLPAAREGLEELRRLAAPSGRVGPLAEEVRRAAEDAEARRLAAAAGRVEDLMSVGDFDQARRAADKLLKSDPDSPAAIALLSRVQREAEAFETEQRRQMLERLQKAAAGRHWREAREVAEALVHAYPDSKEGESARAQLETIRTNARLEYARQLRDQIRDLISRRRFAHALEIARRVVHEFPETNMAEELKGQMARLEELAAKGDAGEGGA